MVNRCYMCKCYAESCNHLLLWCPPVYDLWTSIYGMLGIKWAIAGLVKNELWAWARLGEKKKYLMLIPLSLMWVVWKEKNSRAFEGIENDFNSIKDRWFHLFGSLFLGHNIQDL